jgi:hypothetical protein
MVSDALAYADLQLNGQQTRHGDRFFRGNDLLMATPDDFRVPAGEALASLHRRLEPERYRAVAVCNPSVFAALCAPHIAHFWRLRLVDGYSSGIPTRLASLPWPEGVVSLRAITFASTERLPWSLLALLNVKHAVRVTPAWFANRDTGPKVEVTESPLPVAPRVFLTAALHPVGSVQEALHELFGSEEPGRAPEIETRSVVERLVSSPALVRGGRLRARFRPGRVSVDLEPMGAPQFVVVNELYHPDWRAYAGTQRLGVYPTNVVMTGVLVPPGADHLELRFEPFVNARTGALFASIALLLTGTVAWRLASSDRQRLDPSAEVGGGGASR